MNHYDLSSNSSVVYCDSVVLKSSAIVGTIDPAVGSCVGSRDGSSVTNTAGVSNDVQPSKVKS